MFKKLYLLLTLMPAILFSQSLPAELYLGAYETFKPIEYTITLTNECIAPQTYQFYSLCECLEISPDKTTIAPNSTREFTITLQPEGYTKISRHFLVDKNGEKSKLRVYADIPEPPTDITSSGCLGCGINEAEISDREGAEKILSNWTIMDIYYSPGCESCEEFIEHTVSDLEETLNISISLNRHNILESSELEELEAKLEELGAPMHSFPMVLFNDVVIQGDDVAFEPVKDLLTTAKELKDSENKYKETIKYLKPIPILAAGLIDGINPCAFTTLLFLISSLFYIGRGRKEILQIGLVFSITIFVSYYLVGLGMLNIVRTANFFPIVSKIIKYLLIVVLVALGLFSLYDALQVKRGKIDSIKLQLPKKLKKKIHKVIKENTRTRGMITGTIIIGIMVTIFELTCTGQVYLPIIAYIIKIEGSFSAYFYLTLYNLGFITPLLIVFITIYKGTTNQKLITWFQGHLFPIKIALALFFFSMIIFL